MRVEFEAFGHKQVARNIMRVSYRGQNLRPVFIVMSKYFYAMEKALFESEGASGGERWPDLAASTVRRRGTSHPILRVEDVLLKSLTRPNARFSMRQIKGDSMKLGTTDPKAVHHYFGAPRANVPKRRPIVFREVDKVQWVKLMQNFIITGNVPAVPGV